MHNGFKLLIPGLVLGALLAGCTSTDPLPEPTTVPLASPSDEQVVADCVKEVGGVLRGATMALPNKGNAIEAVVSCLDLKHIEAVYDDEHGALEVGPDLNFFVSLEANPSDEPSPSEIQKDVIPYKDK